MYNDIASPFLINCTIARNSGLGVKNVDAKPTLTNCIIWGNGGGMSHSGSPSTVAVVTYSIVQGGYGGTGNLDTDPLFVSASDLRLQACSPAIDAGSDAANTTSSDLFGSHRKFDAIAGGSLVDMGAFEYQQTVVNTTNTTTITACDTYTWATNGQTYTQSGIYPGPTAN
jgi:hypothetical protein